MVNEQYCNFKGIAALVVPNPSGRGAPDFRVAATGQTIDYYSGQPIVSSGRVKTIEECVLEAED